MDVVLSGNSLWKQLWEKAGGAGLEIMHRKQGDSMGKMLSPPQQFNDWA